MLEAVAPPLTPPPLRPPPGIALFFSAKKVCGGAFNRDFLLQLRSYKKPTYILSGIIMAYPYGEIPH